MTTSRQPQVSCEHIPRSSYIGLSHTDHGPQQYFSFLPLIVQGYTDQAILFRVPIYHGSPHTFQLAIQQVCHATSTCLLAKHFTRYAVGTAKIVEVSLRGS